MSIKRLAATSASMILLLAACSSGGGGSASAAPSSAGGAASPAAAVCHETTDPGEVTVSAKDFLFEPATITAQAGQVIAFQDAGSAPHNATLDGGACATKTMQPGQGDGLVFTAPGSYPFHCTIHPQMKGTIKIE